MAETTQSISNTLIKGAKSYYTASSSNSIPSEKPEPSAEAESRGSPPVTEDNISLMFSTCDSLNDLYIKLEKLYHALKMKNLELRIKQKEEEKRLLSKATSPHRIRGIRKRLKKGKENET